MNIAKVVEIDGKPTLVIYAHTTGSHQHRDTIDGVTLDGECISRRFPNEEMPTHGDIQPWLINKTQDTLGAAITFRPWNQGRSIHIQAVAKSPAQNDSDSAAA